MRNAARQEHALAGSQASRLTFDDRRQFAFDDEDRSLVPGVDMDRRPRVTAASVLEEAELPRGLISGQQALHDDAGKDELLAVGVTHGWSFPRIEPVKRSAPAECAQSHGDLVQ